MPTPAATATHYRICPLCEACCGLEIRTEADKVLSIRGMDSDVLSRGYICPKAVALKDLHEDPDRLRQPLLKRNGQHVAVSWDEAFAEIERRLPPLLAAQGRDALALSVGNPAAHKMGLLLYFARLVRAAGTKNVFSASTLDQMPKQLQSGLMFGNFLSIALPDITRTDFMLVLGANPMASNGSMWTVPDFRGKARALRARGGRLVVIDPRRTETAEVADAHHFIRPGTDVHLLGAMLHTLFAENLVRLGRLTALINGVDELRNAVAAFTPERAAARCGIPADTLRVLARQLAGAERACVYARLGTCTQRFGTLTQWFVDALNTLTGHLDEPGGMLFAKAPAFAGNTSGRPGSGRGVVTGRHRSRVSGAPEVFGELPMVRLAEEIETAGPGQVRALITVGSNPVLSAPNGPRIAAALDTLDFMVSLDIYLNETTRHADVILPGLSPLEDSHYDIAFPQLSWRNQARYSTAVFPAPAGQPAEWQSLLRLIAILKGRGADADLQALDDELIADDVRRQAGDASAAVLQAVSRWTGPERLLDLALRSGPYGDQFGAQPEGLNLAKLADAPGGIDLGELQPRLPELLRTASGRIELAPPSLLADVPHAVADLDSAAEPLLIIGRRDVRSNNSWMHNLPLLAKGPQRCTLLMHPQDAASRGLADGATVAIQRDGRAIQAPLQCSESVMPGVVSLPHGWGHDLAGARLSVAAQRPGASLNAILDDAVIDPLSGNAVLSGVAVTVAAV
ncbi:molybdopterin-dependent oxidoreductase [Aquabacterium sp.]|uniref:molybdopterin-dependent oxidoreductase n=1 Tax=Aquabacterium sp. TaxID=1872578 RepID=UPI002BE8CCA2|nr:molybdopterin-dependent oxidoreductase [Aquabacterium sp.]HSW05566.1 molybdopterin-dependent oxidoreductase [Aquabacterium sp.]